MRLSGEWPVAGRIVAAAVVCAAASAALAGCASAGAPGAVTTQATGATGQSTAATSAPTTATADAQPTTQPTTGVASPPVTASQATGPGAFAVSGTNPVTANGSQSTYAATPGTTCDAALFAQDMSTGRHVADGFSLAGFPASADLLDHFLQGKGTAVDYPAGSSISKLAQVNSAFLAVNQQVQGAIRQQLQAGGSQVTLLAAQLPLVAFESANSDLYWGFRGTQGLTVTGSGARAGGRYVGTLTYVIRDSYGFPANDTLAGFGAPMRYLQTTCGAPQHPGGAHWFPDSITVTVPFNQPA